MIKIDRFRSMADKLRSDAESKLAPRETHTAKKLGQARSAERDGLKFKRAAVLIDAFCDLIESGNAPEALLGFKPSKDAFLTAASLAGKQVSNGFHGYYVDSDEHSDVSTQSLLIRKIADRVKTPEETAEDQRIAKRMIVDRALDGLRGCDIPGFFPTPSSVIEMMLDEACIEDHHSVLEPSAGIGSIVDAILANGFTGEIDVIEWNGSLCNVLMLKGIEHRCMDFMDCNSQKYDRILMNPPFERKQAIKHVEHAYKLLNPGGRLVAIMPVNHAQELDIQCDIQALPDNCFNNNEAFRRTGVSVAMVTAECSPVSAIV